MERRLYNDLSTQTLSDTLGGQSVSFPQWVQGTDQTLRIRFQERVGDTYGEKRRVIEGVRATVGVVDARPTGGTFKLGAGGEESAALAYNATGAAMTTAFETLFPSLEGIEAVSVDGSWLVSLPEEMPAEVTMVESLLSPAAFLRMWGEEQDDGTWLYELRLVQTPVAFTDQFVESLPPGPEVSVVTEGADVGGVLIPEVQALRMDPWYPGIFRLQRGLRVSGDLSAADGPDEITAAIQSLLTASEVANGATLTASNPADGVAHITFGGYLAGVDEDLLEVVTVDSGFPDPVLTINLDTAELASALRKGAAEFQMEIVWTVRDDTAADPEDEETRTFVGYRGAVTIVPALGHPSMALVPSVDWLRPPVPRTYLPFSKDQVFVGTRHYVSDPIASYSTVTIDHNLGTDQVIVTAIDAGGIVRFESGIEAQITSEDSLDVTVVSPADLPVRVMVSTVGALEYFQAHTHTIEDIPDLVGTIAALEARLASLEDLRPLGLLALPDSATSDPVARWALPRVSTVFPARKTVTIPESGISTVDVSGMRLSGLLPAVHTVTAPVALAVPVPPKPSVSNHGKIYRNETGGTILLPGGLGRPGVKVPDDGLVAAWVDSSGNAAWYPVEALAGTSSYYPTQMEVPLFEFAVTEEQLQPGRRLTINFSLEVAVLRAATRGQWELLVEWGAPGSAASPGTPGVNLSTVTWNTDNPALRQKIYASPLPTAQAFAVRVASSLESDLVVLSAEKTAYQVTAATTAPAGSTFFVRGRLARWDVLDAPDILGFAAVRGLDVSLAVDPATAAEAGVAMII